MLQAALAVEDSRRYASWVGGHGPVQNPAGTDTRSTLMRRQFSAAPPIRADAVRFARAIAAWLSAGASSPPGGGTGAPTGGAGPTTPPGGAGVMTTAGGAGGAAPPPGPGCCCRRLWTRD